MRLLVVHNTYRHKGGEDTVVDAEVALLRNRGHEVELFTRNNDSIASMFKIAAAADTVWSAKVAAEFEVKIRSFQPDLVHVHNTFPLISPAIYWVAARFRVPVVQTLHNFRLMCPQAMFLRDGKICEDCLGKLPWRGAARGCYRGSLPQSTILAGMVTVHRAMGTWQNKVTRYIALNEFCRNKFIAGGLPAKRIAIKPNFVDLDMPEPEERQGFLFVGRLSPEKGLDVLVNAMRQMDGGTVRIAGSGSSDTFLSNAKGVVALGALPRADVYRELNKATALVIPSIWYETFGMVAVEAFASGTPVIASNVGVLPNLVKNGVTGLLFESGNSDDLAQKMRWALANPESMLAMGRNARQYYEAEFTADSNYQQLMAIYESAIAEVKSVTKP